MKQTKENSSVLAFPRGSIDYDMSFIENHNKTGISRWRLAILSGEVGNAKLPVDCTDVVEAIKNGTEIVDMFPD